MSVAMRRSLQALSPSFIERQHGHGASYLHGRPDLRARARIVDAGCGRIWYFQQTLRKLQRCAGYCFSAVTQRVVTLAWNVGHLLVTLSSSPSPEPWPADRHAPVKGVPINNGRSPKQVAAAKAQSPPRKGPAPAHEVVVAEALRIAQYEKQNNTQCVPVKRKWCSG